MHTVKREIDAQFDALQRTAAYIRGKSQQIRSALSGAKKLLVLGAGSSYYLAKSLALQFDGMAGIPACAIPAGDYLLNRADYAAMTRGAAVVTISRSGSTSEILRAAESAGAAGAAVISLCGVEDAGISKIASLNLELPWIFDDAVCQTRTVSNLYAAGLMMAAICAGDEAVLTQVEQVPALAPAFSRTYEGELNALAQTDWDHAVVLADSYWAGLAEEGALAFKEVCRLPSNHYHLLDVRHGPMVIINRRTLVVAMANSGDGLQRDLLRDIRAKGARLLLLDCAKDAAFPADCAVTLPLGDTPCAAALFMIYAIQLLTYYKAVARGENPDEPVGLDPWIKL